MQTQLIDKLLAKAKPPEIKGEIFGLILPHADYRYSGQTAAWGYKAIAGKKFDTVIIIADSHYEYFDGVSIWPQGFWETPLGKIEVDSNLAKKIMADSKRFFRRDSAHLFEHSIETQLPFLQRVLKNFKILPIIFGSENKDWRELAKVILKYTRNKKILIIVSTDLSHYLPRKKAIIADKKTLDHILSLQNKNLEVCAKDAVRTLLAIAKMLGAKTQLLKYQSGQVGYAAIVFYLP